MKVTAATATQADDGLEPLLLALRQARWLTSSSATPTATQIATAHATPTHIQRSASRRPSLAQERGDDADDQRGLDAFSQADDEGREHQSAVGAVAGVSVNSGIPAF